MYKIRQETAGLQAPVYCDEFILGQNGEVFFASIFGPEVAVKAITAQIITRKYGIYLENDKGHPLLNKWGRKVFMLRGESRVVRATTAIIKNGVQHKVLYAEAPFQPWLSEMTKNFLSYGATEEDMVLRAFKIVNRFTTAPLKEEWRFWLWDHIKELNPYDDGLLKSQNVSGEFLFFQEVTVPEDDEIKAWIMADIETLRKEGKENEG